MARTRAEDFDTKRRAILRAAAEVLADPSAGAGSMAQIAAGAEVSKALLYHTYPGRDALVFAIVHDHLAELECVLAAADDPALPPPARLRALIHALLVAYRDADNAHRVQLNATPTLPAADRARIVALERAILRRFADALRDAAPDLPAVRVMPATMSLMGMLSWVWMWFKDDGPLGRADYADLVADLMLGGLPALAATAGSPPKAA